MAKRNPNVLHFDEYASLNQKRNIIFEKFKERYEVNGEYYYFKIKTRGLELRVATLQIGEYGNRVRVVVSDQSIDERKSSWTSNYQKSFREGEGTGKARLSLNKVYKYIDEISKEIVELKVKEQKEKRKKELDDMMKKGQMIKILGNYNISEPKYDSSFNFGHSNYMQCKFIKDGPHIRINPPYNFIIPLNEKTVDKIKQVDELLKELYSSNVE